MKNLNEILKDLVDKKICIEDAEKAIKVDYLTNIDGFAQLDFSRQSRTGIPEVIFAESKTTDALEKITADFLEKNGYALLTRVKPEHRERIRVLYQSNDKYIYQDNPSARTIFIKQKDKDLTPSNNMGKVGIITAGTSDVPIAEEAREFLEIIGIKVISTHDVGIAGFHRIFHPLRKMVEDDVCCIIVVAGMEGTLPGVVSALVDIPVIGVPTSTGYGLGEKGIGALTTMLQSCSPGLAVVNIDNGFGAAAMAALIAKRINNH